MLIKIDPVMAAEDPILEALHVVGYDVMRTHMMELSSTVHIITESGNFRFIHRGLHETYLSVSQTHVMHAYMSGSTSLFSL